MSATHTEASGGELYRLLGDMEAEILHIVGEEFAPKQDNGSPERKRLLGLLAKTFEAKKQTASRLQAHIEAECNRRLHSLMVRERNNGLNMAATINYELSKELAAKGMFGQDGQSALLRSTERIAALEAQLESKGEV